MNELGFAKLGIINLTVLYLSFMIASPLAVPINKKLGTKLTLFLASLTYVIWVAAFILPAYKYEKKLQKIDLKDGIFSDASITAISLITASINGFGAGPLWVAQANYVTSCSNESNKGRFQGWFFAIFYASSLLSNLLAGVLIEALGKTMFYLIMTFVSLFASIYYLFLT